MAQITNQEMGTAGHPYDKSEAVKNDEAWDFGRRSSVQLETISDEIEDGRRPWWSGLVWLAHILVGLSFYAVLIYALLKFVF